MIDLEQEFQLLMRNVERQIEDKVTTGQLTQSDANRLLTMISTRMVSPVEIGDEDLSEYEVWSASTQACYGSDYRDDGGWSGSSRNC